MGRQEKRLLRFWTYIFTSVQTTAKERKSSSGQQMKRLGSWKSAGTLYDVLICIFFVSSISLDLISFPGLSQLFLFSAQETIFISTNNRCTSSGKALFMKSSTRMTVSMISEIKRDKTLLLPNGLISVFQLLGIGSF